MSRALLALLLLASSGASAQELVRVSAPGRHTLAPEVAVDARGHVHVIWLDKEPQMNKPPDPDLAKYGHSHLSSMDLYYARSTDGGKSFSAPVRVNRDAGLVWGFAVSRPRVAAGASGTVHIFYPANEISDVNGKAVLTAHYTRSTDGGKSFEPPKRLHALPNADLSEVIHGGFASAHAFGTMGLAPDGSIHTAWIDTRDMKPTDGAAAVYVASSRDDGKSFAADRVAFATEACPCCQLTLAFDSRSNLYLGSRRVTTEGLRLATVARIDAGTSSAAQRVSIGGAPWKIDGCPLKPTVVAVDGRNVYAASYNGAENPAGVYFSVSSDGGASFSAARAVHPEAQVSDSPSIALARGEVLLAWHGKAEDVRRVFWRSAGQSGSNLGPIVELASPPGTAQSPALAARGDGRVQLVWQQGEEIYTTVLAPGSTGVAPRATARAIARVAAR